MPSACNNPLALISLIHEGISLLKASAFWKRQPSGSPLRLPMANDEQMGSWLTQQSRRPKPSPSPYVVVSLLFFVPTSVAPYFIISSVINWRFCGVLSNYHFVPREAGKSLMNSSSQDAFNAPNTCRPFVGPIPDEGIASSSMRFSLLYIQCFFLIFLHFIFADYWERQRERPSLVTPSF